MFLLVVLGASAAGGRALGLTIAALAFLSFDFFFLLPYATLTITNPLDWLALVAFLITSVVATQLLYRANATAEAATQRALEVDRLAMAELDRLSKRFPPGMIYRSAFDTTDVVSESIRASSSA